MHFLRQSKLLCQKILRGASLCIGVFGGKWEGGGGGWYLLWPLSIMALVAL